MDYRSVLLNPIRIGNKNCRNRFFAQPMECVDSDAEGNPTELTLERYSRLYDGGFGLVDLEAITVTNESRARKTQLEIMPRNVEALKRFIRSLKEVNPETLIVFQLTHSGEISESEFSRKVCVKPLYGVGGDLLTEEEVDRIMDQFVLASQIVEEVGADGIDMKLCHGYLGSQILRPFNDRDWKYGGPWERRVQWAYDLMERIKGAVGKDFLIGSKVSMFEGFPGGCGTAGPDSPLFDMTEPLDMIRGLEERGASYFVETLGNVHTAMHYMEADQDEAELSYLHIYFANMMKKALKPETVVIGSGFSPFRGKKSTLLGIEPEKSQMLAMGGRVISDGCMDMIGLGRQSFADPYTPRKLEEGREDEIRYCTQCMNCEELMIRQQPVGCVRYNPFYTKKFAETRQQFGRLAELHT